MASAPDGSTTSRARSAASRTPAAISASRHGDDRVEVARAGGRTCAGRAPASGCRRRSSARRARPASGRSRRVASDSCASAASSGSTPMTRAAGAQRLDRPTATPLARPPPPIGTRTAATSGRSSTISRPTVPWPAMIRSSSNGGMTRARVGGDRLGALAGARRTPCPTMTISAPSAATRSRLIAGASDGMTTTAGAPSSRAARATPWAWLPDE